MWGRKLNLLYPNQAVDGKRYMLVPIEFNPNDDQLEIGVFKCVDDYKFDAFVVRIGGITKYRTVMDLTGKYMILELLDPDRDLIDKALRGLNILPKKKKEEAPEYRRLDFL